MFLTAWIAFPLIGAIAIILAWRAVRSAIPRNLCIRCRYDLAGIWAEALCCPECGHGDRGHPVIAADSHAAALTIYVVSLALVWWSMITLAILGITMVCAGGYWAAAAQIGR
jgi:hypothetical protein